MARLISRECTWKYLHVTAETDAGGQARVTLEPAGHKLWRVVKWRQRNPYRDTFRTITAEVGRTYSSTELGITREDARP